MSSSNNVTNAQQEYDNIYVGNIDERVDEVLLRELLTQFLVVESVRLFNSRDSSRDSSKFAFVKIRASRDPRDARDGPSRDLQYLKSLNLAVYGRPLKIGEVKKKEHSNS